MRECAVRSKRARLSSNRIARCTTEFYLASDAKHGYQTEECLMSEHCVLQAAAALTPPLLTPPILEELTLCAPQSFYIPLS